MKREEAFKAFCKATNANKVYKHPDFETDFYTAFDKGVESLKGFSPTNQFVVDEMVSEFNSGQFHEELAPHWMSCLRFNCAWAGLLGMCVRRIKAKSQIDHRGRS